MGNAKTKLINNTRRDIEIREFRVAHPDEGFGNAYYNPIPLSALGKGATTRVNGSDYLGTGDQVSLLRIWCGGKYVQTRINRDGTYVLTGPLIANDFIASKQITITQDLEHDQFVVEIDRQ